MLERLGTMFPDLPVDAERLLSAYEDVLSETFPMKAKHMRELHYAVRDLSRALTSERDGLEAGYLSSSRNLGAYLYYFLPWNLVRLARLVGGLHLDLPEGATVIDLGAGPLTFEQALWLARPELRGRDLEFVCLDTSPSSMRHGLNLLEGLTRLAGAQVLPWRISTVHAPVTRQVRERADLVVAANVLNEMAWDKRDTMEDAVAEFAETLVARLKPGGRILVVEPGVRRSGRILDHLRQALVEAGLRILAPCSHDDACPLRTTSWCHFTFGVQGAPGWLRGLTQAARLDKRDLSISFLYATLDDQAKDEGDGARVISDSFPLPEHPDGGPDRELTGVYACSGRGLLLLVADRRLGPFFRSGELIRVDVPEKPARDAKSGALEIPLYRK